MASVPDEHAAPGGAGEVRGNGLPETVSVEEAALRRATAAANGEGGGDDGDGDRGPAEVPGADSLGFEIDEDPSVLAEPVAGDPSGRPTIVWPPGRVEVPAAGAAEGAGAGGGARPGRGSTADFGKYELICELGRGGMGVVYKARHKELDRIVAIKMILASHLASPEQVERFYAEARAAARLNSAQVVGIHDVGQIHGQHYFAMDYVPGPSLAEVVHKGPLDPNTAAHHVYGVARAVALLHQHGIVHRDLKPSNVLLDAEGRVRVTDFGLAKMLQAEGRMTRSGAIVGTPGYMAPEQAVGKGGDVGPASDIYSVGAILYELLTGRPPFSGETPLDTLVQVLEGEPIPPGRLRPGIPKEIEVICLTCLERDPGDRYPSAAALAEDLDRFLRGEQVEARPRGLVQVARRWARREPALASRLGTMGICGAIIQANHTLIQPQEPVSQRWAIAAVSTWALASMVFQALLNRERNPDLVRLGWAAADVIMYTLLVWINQGLQTSLVAGYFLLVAASGLWFREHLVWLTTAMAVAGYGVLVLNAGLVRSIESPYRHVVFVAALAVSGLITGYQVRRVRALSQYYEHRPLP